MKDRAFRVEGQVFIAQFYGIDLSISQYLMVVVVVIMTSIGTTAVPRVDLVLLAAVLARFLKPGAKQNKHQILPDF